MLLITFDPENRLVADSLESDWNEKLRAVTEAQRQYEQQRQADQAMLSEKQHGQLLALATDFPKLWRDPNTPDRERKRMVRLLIEDVTLRKTDHIAVHVRFKGGIATTLRLPNAPRVWDIRRHHPDVVAEIDRLLNDYNYKEILVILNGRQMHSGVGIPFTPASLSQLCRRYKLKTRFERLREKGLLTPLEVAAKLEICVDTVAEWRHAGLLRGLAYNDCNACLYEEPGPTLPPKRSGQSLVLRSRSTWIPAACGQEA